MRNVIAASALAILLTPALCVGSALSQNRDSYGTYGGTGIPSNSYGAGNAAGVVPSNSYGAGNAAGYVPANSYGAGNAAGYVPANSYGAPAQVPLYNQSGFGYYQPNPYANSYPAYNPYAPGVPTTGGYVRFGNFVAGSYWRAPSGYYYPFYPTAVYGVPSVVVVQQQQAAQQTAEPPISSMLSDMRSFLDDQNTKGKFLPDHYTQLSRRLKDLNTKYASMISANGGTSLDQAQEESMRKDLAMLGADMARRAKP